MDIQFAMLSLNGKQDSLAATSYIKLIFIISNQNLTKYFIYKHKSEKQKKNLRN